MLAERIRQARLAAGLTQDEMVARLDGRITKAALSHYENGKRTPHATILKALGDVVGVRAQWFIDTPKLHIEWHAFRSLASLSKRKREEIQALAAHKAAQYMDVWALFPSREYATIPKRRPVKTPEEADSLAVALRKRWMLGLDAIESVTQCLENHGVLIVPYSGETTRGFDGLSATVNGCHPLLIVNTEVPVDRLRFDLLHELGHVLMDTSKLGSDKEEERLAHRFASSFLVPPDVLRHELGTKRRSLMLSELLLLKEKYGMSLAAWIFAAKAHGIIDAALAKSLWIGLAKRGWKKKEPSVFHGNEAPSLLRQLTMRAVAEGLLGVERALEIMPNIQDALEREGFSMESRTKDFAKLTPSERRKRMQEAAAIAAADYAPEGPLAEALEHEGDMLYEYE